MSLYLKSLSFEGYSENPHFIKMFLFSASDYNGSKLVREVADYLVNQLDVTYQLKNKYEVIDDIDCTKFVVDLRRAYGINVNVSCQYTSSIELLGNEEFGLVEYERSTLLDMQDDEDEDDNVYMF